MIKRLSDCQHQGWAFSSDPLALEVFPWVLELIRACDYWPHWNKCPWMLATYCQSCPEPFLWELYNPRGVSRYSTIKVTFDIWVVPWNEWKFKRVGWLGKSSEFWPDEATIKCTSSESSQHDESPSAGLLEVSIDFVADFDFNIGDLQVMAGVGEHAFLLHIRVFHLLPYQHWFTLLSYFGSSSHHLRP